MASFLMNKVSFPCLLLSSASKTTTIGYEKALAVFDCFSLLEAIGTRQMHAQTFYVHSSIKLDFVHWNLTIQPQA
jgi:hypothetical protein